MFLMIMGRLMGRDRIIKTLSLACLFPIVTVKILELHLFNSKHAMYNINSVLI